jgi:uncharacterized membrane protein YdjX (TVP38/TMEM64 family)
MLNKKQTYILGLFFIIHSKKVLSYIDPGTGGMILGSFWSAIVGVIGLIAGFFTLYLIKPIVQLVKKITRQKNAKKKQ